jgi:protein TonB
MSIMTASLVATLHESAHRELKAAYPRIVLVGALLACLVHFGLLLGVLPGASPIPIELRRPEPRIPRVENIDYSVIPEAVPIARPVVPDADFDEIVPDEFLVPVVEPISSPPWAEKMPDGRGSAEPEPVAYRATAEVTPELLHRVAPVYPELARMAGAEGRVLLDVWIDETGRVRNVQVLRSDAASTLEQAAIEAVRQWLFSPARQGGRPVAVRVSVPIEFRLH